VKWAWAVVLALGCQQAVEPPSAKPVGSGSSDVQRAPVADARPVDPADDPAATQAELDAPIPPDFDFDNAPHDQKVRFMKSKVLPAMKAAFQKFDPVKYEHFGCKTCHGKNAVARKYKMPTPDLPQLDFHLIEQGKQKPDTVNFMSKVVKPQMAAMFNRPPGWAFQPGHGCIECHTEKK
jgi:hypothetical protein